ncbi:WG repeat-containing protein [Chryseobacterium sp. MEBOG07]|uniref:WG repeat-containing protein n=1 Tax=Chryseobacterium sp. MEBOG07 TaxID=2879939 RepID=UPI001F3699CE|nr:WG repeat-containing protein [Chryseobacterium sp. MEBOG07]UKB80130.1 WG repeat-containing protein [Chryseobacterium sp. MEBOG07]
MKKKYFFFILFFPIAFFSQGKYKKYDPENIIVKGDFLKNKFSERYLLIGDFMPVEKNSKIKVAKVFTSSGWGFINEKGKEIIPAIYEYVSDFRNGIVSVRLRIPISSKDGERGYDLQNDILTYTGKKLNSTNNVLLDFKNPYYYNKDFFYMKEDWKQGIMSNSGEMLVPFKYATIQVDDDYFFAYFPVKDNNYSERAIDIYSKKGKFIKSFKGHSIQKVYNKFFVIEFDKEGNSAGCFSLNKTFERENKYEYQIFNSVENSNLFKATINFDRGNDRYPTFYIDKNFIIISPDYPNTYLYEDQFLVQPIPVGKDPEKATSFAIIDFKNNKIAEYSYDDFLLYQYFAYGQLDNPKFLESQKVYWKQLKKDDSNGYFWTKKWDYFKNLERRERYSKFFEVDSSGKEISSGYVDATTGKICIKRDLNEAQYISSIKGTDFFQVKYQNTANGNKFDIYNAKGKFIRNDFGTYINTDFDVLNKHNPDYYILDKGKDTLYNQPRNFGQILDKKNMRPIFKDQLMYFSHPHYIYNNVMGFQDFKSKKTGIIDKNYTIKAIGYYDIIQSTYFEDVYNKGYSIIYLKTKSNAIEIMKNKTFEPLLKIEFKPGILKKYHDKDRFNKEVTSDSFMLGVYKSGFYLINEEQMLMDRYGNIIDTPPGFSQRD